MIYNNPLISQIFTFEQYPIRILTGARGTGKTYPVQKRLIEAFLRRGECFVYLRESREEIKEIGVTGFWDDALTASYSGHSFFQRGNALIIDGVTAGIMCALTTIGNVRGATLSKKLGKRNLTKAEAEELQLDYSSLLSFTSQAGEKMKNIFFDEFIPLTPKLVPADRVKLLSHSIETFARMRHDVRVYLCGNLTTPNDSILDSLGFTEYEEREVGIRTTRYPNGNPRAVWVHAQPSNEWRERRRTSLAYAFGADDLMFETGGFEKADYPKLPKREPRQALYHLCGDTGRVTLWRLKTQGLYVTKYCPSNLLHVVFTNSKVLSGQKLATRPIKDMLLRAIQTTRIYFDNYATFELFYSIIPKRRL